MKPCPYCRAEIDQRALQCRHCQRWLDPQLDSTLNADAPVLVLPPRTTSGLAIGSLACGLLWVLGLGSIAAVVLGYLALREIRRDPLRIKGKGVALAGIALGWVGVFGLALMVSIGVYVWKGHEERPREPAARPAHFLKAGDINPQLLRKQALAGGYEWKERARWS